MAKTIIFDYKGKEYTLEYTRKTVTEMERRGFVADDISTKPMMMLPDLFAGAFRAHHKNVDKKIIDEIFSKFIDKENLIEKLAEMYNEPIKSLLDEPEEYEENVSWVASW